VPSTEDAPRPATWWAAGQTSRSVLPSPRRARGSRLTVNGRRTDGPDCQAGRCDARDPAVPSDQDRM